MEVQKIGDKNDIMDCKKVISQLLLERNMNISDLASELNMKPQSLRNKLSRGNYSVSDFQEMLKILDCDLQVITNDTKKVFQ